MSTLAEPTKVAGTASSPRNSAVPLLAEGRAVEGTENDTAPSAKSTSKRRFFGLGKKKDDKADKKNGQTAPTSSPRLAPVGSPPLGTAMRPVSPMNPSQDRITPQGSPRILPSASPGGTRYRSASPNLHSPASSQIFERNVQESHLPGELSPAIPAHIQTEDHIPPVLEASSLAITDDHLNPDEVEIIMHTAHQPAAVTVAASTSPDTIASPVPPMEEFGSNSNLQDIGEDSASNYGALDNADVRRLSFISFADVVQAEHQEQQNSRDSVHLMSLSTASIGRSPSPVRSPTSSHGFSASPPTSGAASMKGQEYASSNKNIPRIPGSPTTSHGTQSPPGELTIETMRQALRKTGSGDLSGARSQPLSAVSVDDAVKEDRPPFR